MALPKWMQQAIRDKVLSPEEATDWHSTVLQSLETEVALPERLHPAAERVMLWEAVPHNNLPI